MLSEAIAIARTRGVGAKTGSDRLIVEDINKAAGRTAEAKLKHLGEDAPHEADLLSDLVIELADFCREKKCSWFLVDQADSDLSGRVKRLQSMRLAHLIAEHESLPDLRSKRYLVSILDVSQLVYQRADKDVDFVGWQERQRLRSRRLVFEVRSTNNRAADLAGDVEQSPSSEPPESRGRRAVAGEAELPFSDP